MIKNNVRYYILLFQLMVAGVSGQSTESVARPAVKERNIKPVHAPTHHLPEAERTVRENPREARDARGNRVKVRMKNCPKCILVVNRIDSLN